MPRKPFSIGTITTLTEAIHQTIHNSDLSLKIIASRMGVDTSTLTRYGLDGSSGAPMPAFRIFPLVQASQRTLVIDFIEKSIRRVAFNLPVVRGQIKDIAVLTIQAMSEFAEFLQEIEKALWNNGKIDASECPAIQWECYQSIQKILELLSACDVNGGIACAKANTSTLEEAIYNTVHHGDIPLRRIAEQMGIESDKLTMYGDSSSMLPAYQVAPLVLASKKYFIPDLIERDSNRIAFQLPSFLRPITPDLAHLTIQTMKEFSDFIREIENSISNGSIEAAEYQKIQWECHHAIQKILETMSACEVER